ncbi:DUF2972 domain-containing protein, partial [Helicobacter sp. UBA3407]
MQSCKDYPESLSYKYHLAYLLGEALSKADKIWYKGGYFTLNKKIKEAKHIYKLHQEYKAKLQELHLSYCFIPKEFLLDSLSFLKAIETLMHKLKSQENNSFKIESFFFKLFSQIPFSTQTPFLLKHKEEILQWLNSKEFKEQYINTNHPYPPLLNPERLNAKRESKEKNNHNKETELRIKERESKECNVESQRENRDSIQPYPNLSYESIPAELAWDLNLPLPRGYGFVWLGGHGVGMVALYRFFTQACNLKVDLRWDNNSKMTYINRYNFLKNNQNEVYKTFNISDVRKEKDFTKYLCLVSQPKAILWSVRCPIGLLKHALGVDWGNRWWRKDKEVQQTFNLTYNWNKYIEWLRYNKPTINPNFESLKSNLFIMNALSSHFNLDKVYYLDMSAISHQKAFETLESLSKIFGFSPPSKESESIFKCYEFRGNLRFLLPLKLYANKADIPNLFKKHQKNKENLLINKSSIVLMLNRPQNDKNAINILPQINQSDLVNDMGIYVSREDLEVLEKDKEFYNAIKEYLKDFCDAIKEELDKTEANRIKEEDILIYLKENKEKRIELKNLLDKELSHIKQMRPDIVESWKYYQEFERMCE